MRSARSNTFRLGAPESDFMTRWSPAVCSVVLTVFGRYCGWSRHARRLRSIFRADIRNRHRGHSFFFFFDNCTKLQHAFLISSPLMLFVTCRRSPNRVNRLPEMSIQTDDLATTDIFRDNRRKSHWHNGSRVLN